MDQYGFGSWNVPRRGILKVHGESGEQPLQMAMSPARYWGAVTGKKAKGFQMLCMSLVKTWDYTKGERT